MVEDLAHGGKIMSGAQLRRSVTVLPPAAILVFENFTAYAVPFGERSSGNGTKPKNTCWLTPKGAVSPCF